MKNPINLQATATFIGKNEFHVYKRLGRFTLQIQKYELQIDIIRGTTQAVIKSYQNEADFLTDWEDLVERSLF